MTTENPLRLSMGEIVPSDIRGGIVAIGNFDGVHRGHQALLMQAVALARDRDGPSWR